MRLIPAPNSYFLEIKCTGCLDITTVFSHAQTVVICQNCSKVLCQPTGGVCTLAPDCSYRAKVDSYN